VATGKATLRTGALDCTPDWFQQGAERVIYSNRNPALFSGKYNGYGLTMLTWASVAGIMAHQSALKGGERMKIPQYET